MNSLLEYINQTLKETGSRPFLIAIDGNCGSGKTTLGNYLSKELKASLFHMDDFFLQPHQRTAERLSEPGGNVDYERFKKEILAHIADAKGITFRPFSCHEWKLADEPVTVPYNDIVVVEGSYSHHPYFENIYNLKIFLEITKEEQKKRIIIRDGEAIWPMFEEKWIPMENTYFETFKIKENSDYTA
jgi:uridine kinase